MLSDEEIVLKRLKETLYVLKGKNGSLDFQIREMVEDCIRVIEKQSKEIEHQKEKRENQKKELAILNAKQIEFNKLVNTVNSYKGQFKRLQKEIEELKEDRKKYAEEYIHNNPWLYKQLNENYILRVESEQRERKAYIKGTNDADKLCNKKWEDKIKAKIEELEKLNDESTGIGYWFAIYYLQSLLEKE